MTDAKGENIEKQRRWYAKNVNTFFRYDYGYYICRRRNDCRPRVELYESCDKGERRGYEE